MIQTLRKPHVVLLLALVCWAVGQTSAWARSEYEVKAAYLYNFTKFITWPQTSAQADEPIDLCIYGEDPFRTLLEPISRLKALGRPLRLQYPKEATAISGCEVLFISASEARFADELLAKAHAEQILTVSDIRDFAREGGMIGFVTVGNVIRFQINLQAARSAGLQISAKLLELAQDVLQ